MMRFEAICDTGKMQNILVRRQIVTEQHGPFVPKPDDPIVNYGNARASIAASQEVPNGTEQDGWNQKHQHQTVRSPPI